MEQDSRISTWYKYHYITTTMTSKKDETICLTEWGFAWKCDVEPSGKRMWNHSSEIEQAFIHCIGTGTEEDMQQHSAQHDFLAASLLDPHLTQVTQMLPSVPAILILYLTCETLIPFSGLVTSESYCAPHRPHTLCCTSLCTLTDGLKCFALLCWQMPKKCHMQSPSGSALHRAGWWLSVFPPSLKHWGRMIWAPCQQRY